MIQYAYFRMPDNTIGEQLLSISEHFKESVQDIAIEHGRNYGWELLSVANLPWENDDWEIAYAALERQGFFTAERQEQLFDIRTEFWNGVYDNDGIAVDPYYHN